MYNVYAYVLSTFAGCETCPEGYHACGGSCWRRLESVETWGAATDKCREEGERIAGDREFYAGLPSPQNADVNACAFEAADGAPIWLGFYKSGSNWLDYFPTVNRSFTYTMDYSNWAWGEPNNLWWKEDVTVLVPPGYSFWLGAGWHDYPNSDRFYPVCQTRYCL